MIEDERNCEKCRELQSVLKEKLEEIDKLKCVIQTFSEQLSLKSSSATNVEVLKDGIKNQFIDRSFTVAETQTVEFIEPNVPNAEFRKESIKSQFTNRNVTGAETQTLESDLFEEDNCNIINDKEIEEGKEVQDTEFAVNNKCHEQDYIFDDKLNLFHSPSTGYYYDQNKGLLYDPYSGNYFKYDYSERSYKPFDWTNNCVTADETCEEVADQVSNLNLNGESENPQKGMSSSISTIEISGSVALNTKQDEISLKQPIDELFDAEDVNKCTSDWQPEEGSNVTVTDLVKDVICNHYGMSDYTYDEQYRMYYSSSTGYFFDADRNLLYDPYAGMYYTYDSEKQSYTLYDHNDTEEKNFLNENGNSIVNENRSKRKEKNLNRKMKKKNSFKRSVEKPVDCLNTSETQDKDYSSLEEGEIVSSNSDCSESDTSSTWPTSPQTTIQESDSSDAWPPCIRAIVEESSKLKIGSLLLITCIGGILGRDRSNEVYIPDISVSKAHAEIIYNTESWHYSILDLGSQNGTFVNEERLSEPKEKSKPHVLKHGDKLSLGSLKLLLHIHDGMETCLGCEPGQIIAEYASQNEDKSIILLKTKEEKERDRRQELRKLKKKFGLESMAYTDGDKSLATHFRYQDRAKSRRKTIGSQNPYEKNEEASTDKSISTSNKGYQLLKKMGWSEGQSLGATHSEGITEPIPFRSWTSKAGLGSDVTHQLEKVPEDKRNRKWIKAQERYFKLS